MCNILGISLCVCGISLYVCNMRCWLSVILYPSVTGPHPFSSCSRGDDITITTRSVIFLEYLYRSAIFLFQLISWYANDITTTTPFLFFFTTRWYYNNNIHSLAIDITIDVMICKWYSQNIAHISKIFPKYCMYI